MTVDAQFNSMSEKLQLLLKEFRKLQRENDKLQLQLNQQHKQEQASIARLQELEQKIDVLKVAALDMPAADKKSFERKISQYIKDVDRCIAVLSE